MIKSYNLSNKLIQRIKLHNHEIENKINLKVGESLLIETILNTFYANVLPTKTNIETRILEIKKQKIYNNYPYRIKK